MLKNETMLSSLTELKACFKMAQILAFRIFSIIINIVQQYSSIQIRRSIESMFHSKCVSTGHVLYTIYTTSISIRSGQQEENLWMLPMQKLTKNVNKSALYSEWILL